MSDSLAFGRFELSLEQRRLREHGSPVTLGARAFDLLAVLVWHRDRVVSKEELLRLVWRDAVVEENNLSVQVSTLRKVLGADALRMVSGHGYRFTLPVSPPSGVAAAESMVLDGAYFSAVMDGNGHAPGAQLTPARQQGRANPLRWGWMAK